MMQDQLTLNKYLTLVVKEIREEAEDIRSIELGDLEDWDLPQFYPGAHIDVHLSTDLIRQYSLCGDPSDRRRYYIAVRVEKNGRGGSLYVHQNLNVGDVLSVSLPRNLFPIAQGKVSDHLLIAGGVGITPFMSMIPVFLATGQSFFLHICARDPGHLPFRSQLEKLVAGGLATIHYGGRRSDEALNIRRLLKVQPEGRHAYCCGPQDMIDEFQVATAHWVEKTVHHEKFGGGAAVGSAYTLSLPRRGVSIEVMADETMVAALARNGITLLTSCCAGICGICRTNFLAGTPDHRDYVLSAEERQSILTPCVSGCLSPNLVLDI